MWGSRSQLRSLVEHEGVRAGAADEDDVARAGIQRVVAIGACEDRRTIWRHSASRQCGFGDLGKMGSVGLLSLRDVHSIWQPALAVDEIDVHQIVGVACRRTVLQPDHVAQLVRHHR
jgi:hypothetical protein